MATLDDYERKARLTPGLYAVLPIACTITSFGLDRFRLIAVLVGLLTAAGGTWLLSSLVGDLGRSAQPHLFATWGGAPTTVALRLAGGSQNATQQQVWRRSAEKLTGITLLDAEDEAADSSEADRRISAAVGQLLYLGQEGGEPAVRNENIAFGYQRNLYGFRWVGRGISSTCLTAQFLALFGVIHGIPEGTTTVGMVVSAGFLALWLFLPSTRRTREAAERYTRQLFIAATNHSRTPS